jgi:protein-disulfide isomerase
MRKLAVSFVSSCVVLLLAVSLIAQNSSKPIATVNGEQIYEQELMSVAGTQLVELQKQEYKVKSEALDRLIRKKVVEAEAKKRGISADELFKQEVDSKVAEPSDDEAKGYYLASRSQTTLPFEQIKPQVKQILKNAEIQQARDKYAESLRAKAEVAILLVEPKQEVGYDPARVRGDANAPVTIVEFSDFQCPFCKRAEPTLKELLAKYNGRVKLAYRDFPIPELHPQAETAAEAARCAGEQNKFWEYHDALLAMDGNKLDEAAFRTTAQNVGLNVKSFSSCLATGKFKAAVEQDIQAGSQAGVVGTPGFFINGEFVSGAQPEAEFAKIIDAELTRMASKMR